MNGSYYGSQYVHGHDGQVVRIPYQYPLPDGMSHNAFVRQALQDIGENPSDYYNGPTSDGKPGGFHTSSHPY